MTHTIEELNKKCVEVSHILNGCNMHECMYILSAHYAFLIKEMLEMDA